MRCDILPFHNYTVERDFNDMHDVIHSIVTTFLPMALYLSCGTSTSACIK